MQNQNMTPQQINYYQQQAQAAQVAAVHQHQQQQQGGTPLAAGSVAPPGPQAATTTNPAPAGTTGTAPVAAGGATPVTAGASGAETGRISTPVTTTGVPSAVPPHPVYTAYNPYTVGAPGGVASGVPPPQSVVAPAPAPYKKRERKPLLIVDPTSKQVINVQPVATATPPPATQAATLTSATSDSTSIADK